MPIEISNLPAGTVPVDTDLLAAVQGSPLTTYKVNFAQVRDWIETFILASPWQFGSGIGSAIGGNAATASGNYTIAYGENVTTTGSYTFSFGRNVGSTFDGTFVISDSTTLATAPTDNNQFVATYGNGYFLSLSPTLKGIEIDGAGDLRIFQHASFMNAAGSFSINLMAPTGISSSITFQLPSADAAAGNVMITNGSGALSLSSYATLQGLTLAANATIANAITSNGSGGLFFGTDQLLARSGTVTSNNIAVWNNNGSIKDGGTLGTASTKNASDNAQPTLASVNGTTTLNRLAAFSDTAGTIYNGPATSTQVNLGNGLNITMTPNNVEGLTIRGVSSGFNTSASASILNTTSGQTRSYLSLGSNSAVCQLLYDQVNAPTGFSIFLQSLANQAFNINNSTGTSSLYYRAVVGDKIGTLGSVDSILTVQATGGTSVNQYPQIQILNKQAAAIQNAAGILMGSNTSTSQSFIGTDTINSTGLYLESKTAGIGKMLTFVNATGAATFSYPVTTPKVTFTNSTTSANSFSWATGNSYPFFGTAPVPVQTGSVTAGHIATWSATGVLQDGGVIPGNVISVQILTSLSSTTFTPSAGAKSMSLTIVGGGGGGGGCLTTTSCGSGGDGGGIVYYAGPSQSFTYQCGAAGAGGGSGTGTTGTIGGNTSVNGLPGGNILALGGNPGFASSTVPGIASKSNDSNSGTNGQIRVDGDMGDFGLVITSTFVVAGNGGDSPFGSGGRGPAAISAGSAQPNDAQGYGAGGSGGVLITSGAATGGGTGTQGCIVIYEYS